MMLTVYTMNGEAVSPLPISIHGMVLKYVISSEKAAMHI
jgi:hypothetical protein